MKSAKAHLLSLVTIIATALLAASPLAACAGERAGTTGAVEHKSGARQAERMELKIGWVTVANDGSLHVEFTVRDADGKGVTGLTSEDIAAVSFGRLGYEDEVGLRTVVGQPNKVWLSYFDKSRDGHGLAGNRKVVGLGAKDRLTEEGDGSYRLEVKRPARLLTKFSYAPMAETGVLLRVQRGDGVEGHGSYFWRPALGKRVEPAKMLARIDGKNSRLHAWN